MKVLIPYDGTPEAENALLELRSAGFGTEDGILVVVTDVFLPVSKEEFFKAKNERYRNLEKSGTCSNIPARRNKTFCDYSRRLFLENLLKTKL